MISIFLFYFIWKRFADLSLQFGKSKHNGWLGILVYFGGLLSFGLFLGFLDAIFDWGIDWENNVAIKFMDIPLGIVFCVILYMILKRKWALEAVKLDTIDDIGKQTEIVDSNE